MSDGRIEKMEVDYSTTVDEKIPEAKEKAKGGHLDEAIELLLSVEKQTRSASDAISTGRLLEAIIVMCHDCKKWKMIEEYLVILSKKRGQSKQAVTKMVQMACTFVDKTPDMATKLSLIDALRTVTAGKIYVEVERARLTKQLADIKESENDVEGACTVLQELQVETYGSMDKREKVELILEQMRLCLARHDLIRTQIISKKINTKFFQDADTDALKVKFYRLMIELDSAEGSYLSVSKHYQQLLDTDIVKDNEAEKLSTLRCIVVYALLATFDNEQHDMLHRIHTQRDLEALPVYQELLETFTTKEIIPWNELLSRFETQLKADTDLFTGDAGATRWQALKDRVVEHNIRTIAGYYTRLRLVRLAQLLGLDVEKAEEFLSQAVVNKTVEAKIDRLEGIVDFVPTRTPIELLNDWSQNLNNLMGLVGQTTHLINKEKMIHHVS